MVKITSKPSLISLFVVGVILTMIGLMYVNSTSMLIILTLGAVISGLTFVTYFHFYAKENAKLKAVFLSEIVLLIVIGLFTFVSNAIFGTGDGIGMVFFTLPYFIFVSIVNILTIIFTNK